MEFPGLVARPMGNFNGKSDYHYQCLRCNVDMLKVIQLGISVFSEDGESPPAILSAAELGLDGRRDETRKYAGTMVQIPTTWQFNFNFSFKEDMFAEASIEGARQAGVDFQRLEVEGIDPYHFGALLVSSGMVCDEEVRWISFHAGYDFGFLTKLLLLLPLPDTEVEFDEYMKAFFPSIYDIKHLMKYALRQQSMNQLSPLDAASAEVLMKYEVKGGLDGLAEHLKIKRIGVAHQAGSDSLLTGKIFFKLQERIFNGEIGDEHLGRVWGLGASEHPEQNQNIHSNIHTTPQHSSQLQENVLPGQTAFATPSTPNTHNAGLVSTPAHSSNGTGPLTPGGAGGAFGSFQYNSR
jgi:CCR4-NOT transcription complex subunit 7/8